MTEPNTPPSSDGDVSRLKAKSLRGGAITLVSQGATVVLQMASVAVLARLLSPDDYGVMGMVLSVVALAALFKDLGLSSAAIQKVRLTADQQTNLFWINALFGLLLSLVFAAAAPVVVWFFDRPELLGMTWILSLTFLLGGLGAQHDAMLVRDMHFGSRAIANLSAIVVSFAVSATLAALGFRYWSLAWGFVAGAAARTGLVWWFAPFLPGLWKRGAGTRDMLRFGANVTGFNVVNYFSRNLDNVLIGKFAGADALGFYGRAYQLMLFPVQNLRGPIDSVTYPALCRLQDRPEEWRRYHCQTLEILSLLTMPLVAWMFLVAEPLILLLLGPAWQPVVPLFKILAVVAFVQPCASMVGSVLLSLGQSRKHLTSGAAMAVAVSLAFAIGINWGPQGVALAYVIVMYLSIWPLLAFVYHGTALKVSDFAASISLAAGVSISSAVVAYLARQMIGPQGLWADLALMSVVYITVLSGVIFLIPRSRRLVALAIDMVLKRGAARGDP